jgi:hypothetical protein
MIMGCKLCTEKSCDNQACAVTLLSGRVTLVRPGFELITQIAEIEPNINWFSTAGFRGNGTVLPVKKGA